MTKCPEGEEDEEKEVYEVREKVKTVKSIILWNEEIMKVVL